MATDAWLELSEGVIVKRFEWAKHKELWDELARTGEEFKEDTEALRGVDILNACWCCEAVRESGVVVEEDGISLNPGMACPNCPLAWPGRVCSLRRTTGLYNEWAFARTEEKRKVLAAQIRDLPLAEGWKANKSGTVAYFEEK